MPIPKLGNQFRAIRAAARRLQIDRRQPLSPFLCTYLPALPELIARVEAASPDRFPASRPHGVLLLVVAGVTQGMLIVDGATRVPVRGRISVFGERDGHDHDNSAVRFDRAPYLAICLVARAAREEPVELLQAYMHPCAGPHHLMLVDSNLKRHTLRQLQSVRRWVGERLGTAIDIEKPCFDVGDDPLDAAPSAAREPCIPDFVLRARGGRAQGAAIVVVETMGYGDAQYRDRKQVTHRRMSAIFGGAPVVEHDFHRPEAWRQDQRDRVFWRTVRWTITGSVESPVANRSDCGR